MTNLIKETPILVEEDAHRIETRLKEKLIEAPKKREEKAFQDYDISDFKEVECAPKRIPTSSHRLFFGFNKKRKGTHSPHPNYPVSNLEDVL